MSRTEVVKFLQNKFPEYKDDLVIEFVQESDAGAEKIGNADGYWSTWDGAKVENAFHLFLLS